MTVKNLLNFIAIEVEAGRLSEDDFAQIYTENGGMTWRPALKVEVFENSLEIQV